MRCTWTQDLGVSRATWRVACRKVLSGYFRDSVRGRGRVLEPLCKGPLIQDVSVADNPRSVTRLYLTAPASRSLGWRPGAINSPIGLRLLGGSHRLTCVRSGACHTLRSWHRALLRQARSSPGSIGPPCRRSRRCRATVPGAGHVAGFGALADGAQGGRTSAACARESRAYRAR